jgi:hypothetical protein
VNSGRGGAVEKRRRPRRSTAGRALDRWLRKHVSHPAARSVARLLVEETARRVVAHVVDGVKSTRERGCTHEHARGLYEAPNGARVRVCPSCARLLFDEARRV